MKCRTCAARRDDVRNLQEEMDILRTYVIRQNAIILEAARVGGVPIADSIEETGRRLLQSIKPAKPINPINPIKPAKSVQRRK